MIWSLACLAFVLPAVALQHGQHFENTAIVRAVELGGSLVHVTTTFAVKALSDGLDIYAIALTPEEKAKTSWIQVKAKGHNQPLHISDAPPDYDPDSPSHLVMVRLPKPMDINSTSNLVLETVQTHATRPWPEKAAQDEDQKLKYDMTLFVLSPYRTVVQRTKIRASTPRIHSHTTPTNVDQFTTGAPVTRSGPTITYGPYNDVPPSSNTEFIKNHQMPVVIHYSHGQPVVEVTQLRRAAEISHWGSNLNIQDEIVLHNAGPELKGHFSRIMHQTQSFYKQTAPHILPSLTLQLPAGIRDAYIYDLIGNVSTSRLRISPSSSGRNSLLEFKPRYPLMGGWNYSFTLGWDAPLADSVRWDAANGRYIAQVPIMTIIPGAVIDEAEVKIILPEGATDIEGISPVPSLSSKLSTHVSYLDTAGRPALIFEYKQLTDKHVGSIYVSYKVPVLAHLRKPMAVATAFFGFFLLAIAARRVDPRIHKKA